MRRCPRCGARATSTARYCADCGTQLPDAPAIRPGPIGKQAKPATLGGVFGRSGNRPIGRATSSVSNAGRMAGAVALIAFGFIAGYVLASGRTVIGGVLGEIREITESVRAMPSLEPDRTEPSRATDDLPPGGRWDTVHRISGDSNRTGDSFVLSGRPARIRYAIEGPGLITAWVLPAGRSISDVATTPEVLAAKAGRAWTRLFRTSGRYYVDVRGGGASWTIWIEEYGFARR